MLVDLLGGLGMDDLGILCLVVAHYYRCGWGSSSVCQVQFCVHHSLIILILFFYTSSLQLQLVSLEYLTFFRHLSQTNFYEENNSITWRSCANCLTKNCLLLHVSRREENKIFFRTINNFYS